MNALKWLVAVVAALTLKCVPSEYAGKTKHQLQNDAHGASRNIPDSLFLKSKAADLLRDLTIQCGTPLDPKRVKKPPPRPSSSQRKERRGSQSDGKGKGMGAVQQKKSKGGRGDQDADAAQALSEGEADSTAAEDDSQMPVAVVAEPQEKMRCTWEWASIGELLRALSADKEERVAAHELMLDWLRSIHGPEEKMWSKQARLNASEAYAQIGFARMEMGQAAEALKNNVRSVELLDGLKGGEEFNERKSKMVLYTAHIYNAKGMADKAYETFKKSLEIYPNRGETYMHIASLLHGEAKGKGKRGRKRRTKKKLLKWRQRALELLQVKRAEGDENDVALLLQALFTLNDLLGDLDAAWESLKHARIIDHSMGLRGSWDPQHHLMMVNAMKSGFAEETPYAEIVHKRWGQKAGAIRPIFISGLPRTGSTLLEQKLFTHPRIVGIGEDSVLTAYLEPVRDELHALFEQGTGSRSYEAKAKAVIKRIGDDMLRDMANHSAAKDDVANASAVCEPSQECPLFIVDKMLATWLHWGYIRVLLPEACILVTRRNWMDTLWSCYTNRFTHMDWSTSLDGIVEYIETFQDLVEHWKEFLGPDSFMEVHYEDMVADPDGQIARILSYCGVAEEGQQDKAIAEMQDHRHAEKPVLTASAWQVRQPMYNNSINSWRRYERFLKDIQEMVETRIEAREASASSTLRLAAPSAEEADDSEAADDASSSDLDAEL